MHLGGESVIDVVVVGGGPTGLMLAAELKLHDLDVVVVERDAEPTLQERSLGLHIRSIEILDQRGLLDRFLEHGTRYERAASFAGITGPWPDDLDTAHPYLLGIPQTVTDRLLAEHAVELGVELRRGTAVVGMNHGDRGARVELSDGTSLHAQFIVGCDGGRSTIRKALGIDFAGEPAQTEWLLGAMDITATPEELTTIVAEVRKTNLGFGAGPSAAGGYRIVVPAASVAEDRSAAPTFAEFTGQLRAYAGTDFGAHTPRWLSRFTDATRLAERYRVGPVFLAGDAAHVHPPLGGQGLNLGIQDAFNLGWKLAAQLQGWAPADLLDTYESERRPVAADVLNSTRVQSALTGDSPSARAIKNLLQQLTKLDDVNRQLIEKVTSIGVRYEFGERGSAGTGTPAKRIGRRQRDIPVGDGHLYGLMHKGRGMLLDATGLLSNRGWETRVDRIDDVGNALDDLNAPAMLLRPDGHIAWVGESQPALDVELVRWFGQPAG